MATEPQDPRTQRLALAVNMLWCSLGVGAVITTLQRDVILPEQLKGATAFFLLFAYSLWVVLIVKIRDCRNWARVVLLIAVGYGSIADLLNLQRLLARPLLEDILFVTHALLQWVAVAILFASPASLCFRKRPPGSVS